MDLQASITTVLKIDGKLRAVRLNIGPAADCELLQFSGRAEYPGWHPIESEEDRKAVLDTFKACLAKLAEVDLEKATQR